MKTVLFFSLLSWSFNSHSQIAYVETKAIPAAYVSDAHTPEAMPDQSIDNGEKMSAAKFKHQEYCRAELLNFEYEARFNMVSATVYFSGTNFKGVEKGFIYGSSLKTIKDLMQRCAPGSIVNFDEIKVIGPDSKVRTIQSVTYVLF